MAWRKSGLLRGAKNALLPSAIAPRSILTGPFRGIRMEMNLQSESQIFAGLFEREIYPALRRLTKDVRTVVDIGAAHGEYTLFALLKTGAERVVSFEPNPAMVEKIRGNLSLNALDNSGRLEICAKYIGVAEGPDTVAASRLAEWLQPPCFIKMDIEGAEAGVLAACAEGLLPVPGLRWLIETHSHALRDQCESILASCGYTTARIPQAWWRTLLPELRGTEVGWLAATK